MFNLDEAFMEWRQQMVAGRIKSPQVLDELESHLRDDVEERVRAGATTQRAFEIAVERLGHVAALEPEFEKVGETRDEPERVKNAMLTLAGVPNHYLNETMNTSTNLEPRWATYLKATAFVAPAVCLWLLSTVFVVPKLQMICRDAGGHPLPEAIRVMLVLTDNGLWISSAIILALVLLEWRSDKWPRYRRVTVGVSTFLLNAAVLIGIFIMLIVALLMAPALMHRGG